MFTEKVDDGGFFESKVMTVVDVTLLPWASRLFVLEEYRNMKLDATRLWVVKFLEWRDRMVASGAVNSTIADREKLLESYRRYVEVK